MSLTNEFLINSSTFPVVRTPVAFSLSHIFASKKKRGKLKPE